MSIFERIKIEIEHWRRRKWRFSDVGDHWDAVEDYDDINDETYSYYQRFIDGYRLSDFPDGAHVLDICARTGNGTLHFYERGKVGSVVCADVSDRMGEVCRQRLNAAGLHAVDWVKIDDYDFPLPDQAFDAILFFETLEHFDQPAKFVAELGRVIKPGGQMVLTTPNVLWEPVHALAAVLDLHHSEGPHRFVPLRKIRRMVHEAGFTIEKQETTVLIPGGPQWLIDFGVWVENHTKRTLMPVFGLRRVLICRKQ